MCTPKKATKDRAGGDEREKADSSPVSGLGLQSSNSQDSGESYFARGASVARGACEEIVVSSLSRATGYTTIESLSTSTASSAEVESYVQSYVHDIVAREVDSAGLIKRELEEALKNKVRLERRVRRLVKKSDEQSVRLRRARREKAMARGKLNREMEIHLTWKASELKSCIEAALSQAEESKRRAVELARRDMEEEVSLLLT